MIIFGNKMSVGGSAMMSVTERDRKLVMQGVVTEWRAAHGCSGCGAVYNVHTSAAATDGICDSCGAAVEIRDDDREDVVRNRLRVYRENTEPLLDWYRTRATPLHELAAVGSVDEVYSELLGLVGCS